MKLTTLRSNIAMALAALLVATAPGISMAASLAGSEGDKRFPPYLPNTQKAPCAKAYKAYVAAGGHSAYATTPYSRIRYLYIICGAKLNAPTQATAEELALKSCEGAVARRRVITGGHCEIAASK